MPDWRTTTRTDLSDPGGGDGGDGSSTRILRGADRFRTQVVGSHAVGQTSRMRRSIGGASVGQTLPPTVDPRSMVCQRCGATFVVAIRPDMTQVPCVHCGHFHAINALAKPSRS